MPKWHYYPLITKVYFLWGGTSAGIDFLIGHSVIRVSKATECDGGNRQEVWKAIWMSRSVTGEKDSGCKRGCWRREWGGHVLHWHLVLQMTALRPDGPCYMHTQRQTYPRMYTYTQAHTVHVFTITATLLPRTFLHQFTITTYAQASTRRIYMWPNIKCSSEGNTLCSLMRKIIHNRVL